MTVPFDSQSTLPTPSPWRSRLITACLIGIWAVLAGRLAYLHWFTGQNLFQRATQQRTFREVLPARPGEILDRKGRLLATTVSSRSLFVVPSQIQKPWSVAVQLGQVLNLDPDQLLERLSRHRNKQFLWIKRRLSEKKEQQIRELNLPEAIWGFRDEYLRSYPQNVLAAHVLGLRDIDGKGRGGVEQSFNSFLRGTDGFRLLVRDAHGKVIDVHSDHAEAPAHGLSLMLTVDSVIQFYTEKELDAVMDHWKSKSACAIVLDIPSGEVLAMASRPTFNPNRPADALPNAWKNTSISSIYEPGSTFKPFVIASALEQKVIQADEIFNCEQGEYRMGRRVLHDHHPYGRLSVTDILVKSSNIGMAKIGQRLTNKGLYQSAVNFGFGSPTGIELPGEIRGQLRPLKKWNSYSTGSIPMGQELAVTPIQLITAHAALAHGGQLLNPRIALRQTSTYFSQGPSQSEESPLPKISSQIIDPEIATWIVQQPLTEVVERGTGRKAKLPDYTVFGKTGTAQKIDPKTGKYSNRLHVSSFICGAPAENPRVLVLVVVNEPTVGTNHYGGVLAAPAAREILQKTLRYLEVPPSSDRIKQAQQNPLRSSKSLLQ